MEYSGRITRRIPAGFTCSAQPRNRRGSLFFAPCAFFATPCAFSFWKEVKDKSVQIGLGNLGSTGVGADEKYGG
jgi:hypothetical protein